jgi:hypothetical protein
VSGLIRMRVPVKMSDQDVVTLDLSISDADARKIVDAPRKMIRGIDTGLVQLIRDGLKKFFETEQQ